METDQESQEPITAVVFDFGGVICDDPFRTMGAVAATSGFDFLEFASIAIGHGRNIGCPTTHAKCSG